LLFLAVTLPTRIQRNGLRLYRIGDGSNRYCPSVTTVLGVTSSEKSKRALENWAANNPGAKEAACERGTEIHACCERYLRNLPVNCPEQYLPYWEGMEKYLSQFDDILWSERPMRPEWVKTTVADDGMPRIWSSKYLYSGTPDLVGVRNGIVVLADYKTSSGPYCRNFPKDATDRRLFSGWMKMEKVKMQLAAYAIAFEETLGVHIDATQVIVSTSDMTQNFYVRGRELEASKNKWLERVNRFWEIMAQKDAEYERPPEMCFGSYTPTQGELQLVAA